MKNVTYLLGAGASCNAVPTIKLMPNELKAFINFCRENRGLVTNEIFHDDTGLDLDIFQIEEEFLGFCEVVSNELPRHATIDTYAKKLRIQAGNGSTKMLTQYRMLKALLSGFFSMVQLTNPVDNRYDTFFASILKDSSYSLPENLNILSWNYDFQLEKAFIEYTSNKNKDLKTLQHELNIIPRDSFNREMSNGKFGILKINGTAGYYQKTKKEYFPLAANPSKFDKVSFLKNFYVHYALQIYKQSEGYSLLRFAWEKDWNEVDFDVTSAIASATKNTNVFVVIGYSFPFFNREIDRRIFESGFYNTVYVQDLNPEKVIQDMQSVLPNREIRIIPKKVDREADEFTQFFIPPEL